MNHGPTVKATKIDVATQRTVLGLAEMDYRNKETLTRKKPAEKALPGK
jgi:hypothetical protein